MIERDQYGKPIFPVKIQDILDEMIRNKPILGLDWGATDYPIRSHVDYGTKSRKKKNENQT